MKKNIIIFAILLPAINLCSAQKIVSHNNQQWVQYYNQVKLSEKLTLFSDVSLRRINNFNQWSQVTFRTGVGYPITENLQGITGIACFTFHNNNKPSKIEFRPYQEVNTTQKSGKVSVQHRFRLESRYFRKVSDGVITSASNFNFRFRYRFFFGIPLIKLSESNPDRKILLNLGDEIFINAGKEITQNMLDNNRLLLSPTLQTNNNLSLSFTYTYQFGQRNSPSTYE